MTGEQLFFLAKGSPAAGACVPLNFDASAPRIYYRNGWRAKFWYYIVDYNKGSVCFPQFAISFEIPSGIPVKMCRLRKSSDFAGPAPELNTAEFYENQKSYLEDCVALVSKDRPKAGELEKLEKKWREVLPKALSKSLSEWLTEDESDETGVKAGPGDRARAETGDLTAPSQDSAPKNLAEYWKQQMIIAMENGDQEAVKKARAEVARASQKG